jgi:hypothetical protein
MHQNANTSNTDIIPLLEEEPSSHADDNDPLYLDSDHWLPWKPLRGDDTILAFDTNSIVGMLGSTTDDLSFDIARSPHLVPVPSPVRWVSPIHMPTTLVEYWFSHICPIRSTFDSEVNYNRQVPWSTWTSSEAVSTIMQAMSAACLVESWPELRNTLPKLVSQALTAVSSGIARIQESSVPEVTVDLVFAVLSLGTSIHWFSSVSLSGTECQWLDSARSLLSLWKPRLRVADALLHAYFSQALTYWEMLLAPLGRGSIPAMIRGKRQQMKLRLDNALGLSYGKDDAIINELHSGEAVPGTFGTRPNSWCGISSEVIHIYGQVLALCRSVAIRARDTKLSTAAKASDILCDLSIARELQKRLLAMDFNIYVQLEEACGYPVQTRDHNTPISHLLETAESFRQAALLQLFLSFDDLPLLQEHDQHDVSAGELSQRFTRSTEKQRREAILLKMCLRLAKALEGIPIGSGCKSIHPMLYLAVAVGLRYNTTLESLGSYQHTDGLCTFTDPVSETFQYVQDTGNLACTALEDISAFALDRTQDMMTPVSRQKMEITEARQIVEMRLNILRQMVPHASSGHVLRVVKALWSAYDCTGSSDMGICWVQILGENSGNGLLWL